MKLELLLLLLILVAAAESYFSWINYETHRIKCDPQQPLLLVNLTSASTQFKPIPVIRNRVEIGHLLEEEKLERGVEVGVERGDFSLVLLKPWHACKEFVLVDPWFPQENYKDLSFALEPEQEKRMQMAIEKTRGFPVKVCRNVSSACVSLFPDAHFDFVYIDARHDYKSVLQDIGLWWPKVRDGGIMSGHDFVTQDEGPQQLNQDWTLNFDGTRDETRRVAWGAVVDFFQGKRQVQITYKEKFPSWLVRK